MTLSPQRLEKAARAMRAKRAKFPHWRIDRIYGELSLAAISAYLGDDMVVVPLKLAQRVTSIARRNEDAPEIHELSALLSAELTERDAG